jgi:hypothetical protein
MAADIGPKDTSPKRPFNFTLRRRQCAQRRHSGVIGRFSRADIMPAVQAAILNENPVIARSGGQDRSPPRSLGRCGFAAISKCGDAADDVRECS